MSAQHIVLLVILIVIMLPASWLFVTLMIFKIRAQRILHDRDSLATAITQYYGSLSSLAKAAEVFKDDHTFSDLLLWRLKQPTSLTIDKHETFLKKMQSLETKLAVMYRQDAVLASTPMVLKLLDDHQKAYDSLCTTKRRHNDHVSRYNAMVKIFPNNIVSRLFDYRVYAFFNVSIEPILLKHEKDS